MGENNFSLELNSVLEYMVDVLDKEFPSLVFTPEYLVTSILDNCKCHAHMLLNNCVSSSNLEELRRIYTSWLDTHAATRLFKPKTSTVRYNTDLKVILDKSLEESQKLGTAMVGSEHVLLSMLNPDNGITKIIDVFKNMGIDYTFILSKCSENKQELESMIANDDDEPQDISCNLPIKPKGETNPKAVSFKTKYINQYTTNLNQLVREGKVDRLIGRENELNQIIKVLARRKKNNAILVGHGGVGKTQIVNGIAAMIVDGNVPELLRDKEIVMLNVMSLVSGTHFRGMFEERVNGLFEELKKSQTHILFIDDIQTVLKSTSKEKDTDLSGMIGEILAGGDVRVIATTNFKDYRNSVEINTSISRKFQKIVIEPTSVAETIEILKNNKSYYEDYHNVTYSDEVVTKTVELAHRYITDRGLPDSAIDIIDLAGADTSLLQREPQEISDAKSVLLEYSKEKDALLNNGEFELIDAIEKKEMPLKEMISTFERNKHKHKAEYQVDITIDNIMAAVSEMTQVPMAKLNTDEKTQLAKINDTLKMHVIGQNEAIDNICKVIKRNKVGLGDKNKPLGVFLLAGKSGSGKSLIAKKLAEEIFGSEQDLVRIDMSEYSEKSSVAKLIGAAPGYVGFENGGQLTEAIKNKQHCVLLLDEIEKADPEIYNLFLPLFDEGRLTDNAGQTINFKNVIIIMTSNIGVREAAERGDGIGFAVDSKANQQAIIEQQLKRKFAPEFLNRLSKIIFFNTLTDDNLKDIVRLELTKFNKRLNEISCSLDYTDEVVDYIHRLAIQEKDMGARPIGRIIQTHIEDNVTELLLLNDYNNYTFNTYVEDDKIRVR